MDHPAAPMMESCRTFFRYPAFSVHKKLALQIIGWKVKGLNFGIFPDFVMVCWLSRFVKLVSVGSSETDKSCS